MTLDLEFDDDDAALASAVRRFCADHCSPEEIKQTSGIRSAGLWPTDLWRGLADLGVLALATPEGGGSATSVVAAMEELGLANAPGPLVATFAANQLVDEEARKRIGAGQAIVSMGVAPLMPWLPAADVVIELVVEPDATNHAYLARVDGPIDSVDTLGGEPWGRARLERTLDLGDSARALCLANVALAAYLAGAGQRLLTATAEYAADRVQFRTAIGTFQAVAHPLADSALRLSAARSLARLAADAIGRGAADAEALAATARLSASKAALDVSYRAHQTFGAMGFTVEGPVAGVSARIRQLSMLAPGPTANRNAVLAAHGL